MQISIDFKNKECRITHIAMLDKRLFIHLLHSQFFHGYLAVLISTKMVSGSYKNHPGT